MDPETLAALAGIAVSMTWAPGPNNAMLSASGANYGWRRSVPHVTGVAVGFPVMLVLVASGLGRKGSRDIQVEFLAPRPGTAPSRLAASAVLGGLTPDDVREAVDAMDLTLTREERTAAVTRIVRRRQRASVRVREDNAPYPAAPAG